MDRLDRASLISGAVFVVLGVLFLLDEVNIVALEARYVLPLVLIVAGLVVVIGGLLSREQASDRRPGV